MPFPRRSWRPASVLLTLAAAVSAGITPGASLSAQDAVDRLETPGPPPPQRYQAGISAGFTRPKGTFAEHIKQGWGLDFHGVLYTQPGSPLGLRLDIQWLEYGRQHRDYPYTLYYYGGYRLRETTTNDIFSVTVGPQLAVNGGPFRPYVNVQGGFSYFATTSSFDALDLSDDFDPYLPSGDTHSDDWKLTYNGSAGVNIPLTAGSSQLMLDLGVAYHVNGRTTYLTKGDVTRDPYSGNVSITPRRSEAHYITYRLGVSVAF